MVACPTKSSGGGRFVCLCVEEQEEEDEEEEGREGVVRVCVCVVGVAM